MYPFQRRVQCTEKSHIHFTHIHHLLFKLPYFSFSNSPEMCRFFCTETKLYTAPFIYKYFSINFLRTRTFLYIIMVIKIRKYNINTIISKSIFRFLSIVPIMFITLCCCFECVGEHIYGTFLIYSFIQSILQSNIRNPGTLFQFLFLNTVKTNFIHVTQL